MPDQDNSGHWSSLAAGLGADPPSDKPVESTEAGEPEDVDSAEQADVEEPIVEFVQPSVASPKAAPTDWGTLADDLGIEGHDEASKPASEPDLEPDLEPDFGRFDPLPPKVDLDEPPAPTEESSDRPRLSQPYDDLDQVADEAEEENELMELALDARDDSGFASGVFDDSVELKSDDEEAPTVADVAAVDDLDRAVDDADTDEPPAEKKPGRRRRRRRPRGRKSGDGPVDASPENDTDDRPDDVVAVGEAEGEDKLETSFVADQTESADGEEPPTKTKRRRRRRRGSGRKTTPAAEDNQPDEKESAESDEKPKEIRDDDAPRRRGRRKTPAEVTSKDGQEEEGSGKTAKTSHRAIPSWAEAIDVVISANLENHKKGSSGAGSRSRGGRKRGGREKPAEKTK